MMPSILPVALAVIFFLYAAAGISIYLLRKKIGRKVIVIIAIITALLPILLMWLSLLFWADIIYMLR